MLLERNITDVNSWKLMLRERRLLKRKIIMTKKPEKETNFKMKPLLLTIAFLFSLPALALGNGLQGRVDGNKEVIMWRWSCAKYSTLSRRYGLTLRVLQSKGENRLGLGDEPQFLRYKRLHWGSALLIDVLFFYFNEMFFF